MTCQKQKKNAKLKWDSNDTVVDVSEAEIIRPESAIPLCHRSTA